MDFSLAVSSLQGLIRLALWLAGVGLAGFALVDAAAKGAPLYPAAGKRTKTFWTILLLLAFLFAFVSSNPLSIFFAAGVIAAAVYLTDVRPALRQAQGFRRGGQQGPYGPW